MHFAVEGYGNVAGDRQNFIGYSWRFSEAQRGERYPVLLDCQQGLSA